MAHWSVPVVFVLAIAVAPVLAADGEGVVSEAPPADDASTDPAPAVAPAAATPVGPWQDPGTDWASLSESERAALLDQRMAERNRTPVDLIPAAVARQMLDR